MEYAHINNTFNAAKLRTYENDAKKCIPNIQLGIRVNIGSVDYTRVRWIGRRISMRDCMNTNAWRLLNLPSLMHCGSCDRTRMHGDCRISILHTTNVPWTTLRSYTDALQLLNLNPTTNLPWTTLRSYTNA